jgi:hypothetical protein|tara:strand:- start:183863 stop:184234 length:372 start_codon:yes stop_codon:yes gene_type:complete
MKIASLLCAVIALSLSGICTSAAQAETKFFSIMPDVPVADGFSELTDSILMFDKPEGRLLDFSAQSSSQLACQGALGFYAQSLPHLGWRISKGGFLREGERLEMRLEQQSATLCMLNLSVRPE